MVFFRKIIYLKIDGTYAVNLDKYKPIGTQWICSGVNVDNVTYFGKFGVGY